MTQEQRPEVEDLTPPQPPQEAGMPMVSLPKAHLVTLAEPLTITIPAGTRLTCYPEIPNGKAAQDWHWHLHWADETTGMLGDAIVTDRGIGATIQGRPLSLELYRATVIEVSKAMRGMGCATCKKPAQGARPATPPPRPMVAGPPVNRVNGQLTPRPPAQDGP